MPMTWTTLGFLFAALFSGLFLLRADIKDAWSEAGWQGKTLAALVVGGSLADLTVTVAAVSAILR